MTVTEGVRFALLLLGLVQRHMAAGDDISNDEMNEAFAKATQAEEDWENAGMEPVGIETPEVEGE